MSRSYKKTPRCGDTKDRYMKRYANRKLRKLPLEDTLQHKQYKKNFCSWEICDYETVGETFEQHWKWAVSSWHRWRYRYEPFPNREEEYRKWYKWYKAK